MIQKKVLPLLVIAGTIVGAGISMIRWGKPDGVHGTGWPIPTKVSGLPEDAAEGIGMMADLGMFGAVLNVALVLLAVFLLWALTNIVLRFRGQ